MMLRLIRRYVRIAALASVCAGAAHSSAAAVPLGQLPQLWRDDQGRELVLSSLQGHRVVLTMAYARCHVICPMTVEHLSDMQRAADTRGETIEFVVIGYDPRNDKPADWLQYRRTHKLNRDNWHFLTGSVEGTKQLAQRLGFRFWKYDDHVIHESRAVLFNSQGIPQAQLDAAAKNWDAAL